VTKKNIAATAVAELAYDQVILEKLRKRQAHIERAIAALEQYQNGRKPAPKQHLAAAERRGFAA
jgi:hypothetical protein